MKSKQIKLLFLWAEIGSYIQAVINEASKDKNVNITVVYWDFRGSKSTQHNPDFNKTINVYKRSDLSEKKIVALSKFIKPSITVTSGWMDSAYLSALRYLKATADHCSVCAIDDIWFGFLRQKIGTIYFKFF